MAWLLILALAVVLDLRIALRGDRPLVPATTMAEAKTLVLARKKPGDLVVHSPLFSVTELAALGSLPARPDLPPPEVRATRRILVIDLESYPLSGLGSPSETRALGDGVELRIYEPQGDQPVTLFDLHDDVERAEQRIERPRGNVTSRCTAPRAEGGRACPGEAEWLYLAPRQLVIDGGNTSCIWAHPTTGGDIVITIPSQPEPPPGRRLELLLQAGLTDDAVKQTPDGADVRTDVEQGGRVIGGVTVANRVGWFKASVPIAPGKPVELRVSTPRDGRRHHCVAARVVEVAAP